MQNSGQNTFRFIRFFLQQDSFSSGSKINLVAMNLINGKILKGCLVFVFLGQTALAQTLVTENTIALDNEVQETSGLLNLEGRIITHNDEGGEAKLYEIDTASGAVLRTVAVVNAVNHDWEEITQDNSYIYIGDFGNNRGGRKDLKIYRILKEEYLNTNNNEVKADSILFHYKDQTEFTSSLYTTNYDAEAVIIRNDSLYIFTKNWANHKTYIYSLPNQPGNREAHKIDSLNVQGWITGVVYNAEESTISLIGYALSGPFLWRCSHFQGMMLSKGRNERFSIALPPNIQLEGICHDDGKNYFLSSEGSNGAEASLYTMALPAIISERKKLAERVSVIIYPNPCREKIFVQCDRKVHSELFDSKGRWIMSGSTVLDVALLPAGKYILRLKDEKDDVIHTETMVVY